MGPDQLPRHLYLPFGGLRAPSDANPAIAGHPLGVMPSPSPLYYGESPGQGQGYVSEGYRGFQQFAPVYDSAGYTASSLLYAQNIPVQTSDSLVDASPARFGRPDPLPFLSANGSMDFVLHNGLGTETLDIPTYPSHSGMISVHPSIYHPTVYALGVPRCPRSLVTSPMTEFGGHTGSIVLPTTTTRGHASDFGQIWPAIVQHSRKRAPRNILVAHSATTGTACNSEAYLELLQIPYTPIQKGQRAVLSYAPGVRLDNALDGDLADMPDGTDLAFPTVRLGQKLSFRIQFADGSGAYKRQVSVLRGSGKYLSQRKQPNKADLATYAAREMLRYIGARERQGEPFPYKLEDLVLIGIDIVSKASVQPRFGVLRTALQE